MAIILRKHRLTNCSLHIYLGSHFPYPGFGMKQKSRLLKQDISKGKDVTVDAMKAYGGLEVYNS